MKRTLFAILIISTLPLAATEITVETAVNSQYIWRGMALTDDAVFQPSLTFTGEHLELNIWGNMDLTDDNGHEYEFNETDYTLSYFNQTARFEWTVGVISYTYPNTDFDTTYEAFGGLTFSNAPFEPSVTAYVGFGDAEGIYVECGASHAFANGLELGVRLGYGTEDYVDFMFGYEDGGGFTDYAVSLDYPVALQYGELNFNATWSNLVESSVVPSGMPIDDSNLVLGATYSYSF